MYLVFLILATLLVPIFQFIEDVVMELTGQTRKWSVPFGLRTVTDSAGRHTCIWGSLFVDFFPGACEFLWRTPNGLRIEPPEMFGESPLHRRTKELRHVAHDRMHAPVLNKGPELIYDVIDLLPRKPRYRRNAMKALPRRLVADLAFFDLGLKVSRRGRERKFQGCELDALCLKVSASVACLRRCPSWARGSQSENKAK